MLAVSILICIHWLFIYTGYKRPSPLCWRDGWVVWGYANI